MHRGDDLRATYVTGTFQNAKTIIIFFIVPVYQMLMLSWLGLNDFFLELLSFDVHI